MIAVGLLRGINVGGKNKVDMRDLRSAVEQAGMTRVRTYINTGNVIFSTRARNIARLQTRLEKAVAERCGLRVKVLVRELDRMRAVADSLPPEWVNDKAAKCDVLFLWEDVDRPDVLEELDIRPGIDDVRYIPGAVLWHVDREQLTRSGMMRLVGTPLYQKTTIRNCNTVRRLVQLMEATGRE